MTINRTTEPLKKFYTLMGHTLEQVPTSKYLGVVISDDLKWASHIEQVAKKSNRTLGFLRRNLKYAPKALKETAYKSLIHEVP